MINLFEALLSAVWYTAGAVLFFRMTPERIPGAEKLCRSKLLGIILTLPAALQCVPLAIPVSPGFLLPWLLPVAVILPVLCWYFIDFYAARGFALWMIVSAYGMIHTAFDHHIPGRQAVIVLLWLAGIAGMWISAKPYLLRDLFRKSAENRMIRGICAYSLLVLAVISLCIALMIKI